MTIAIGTLFDGGAIVCADTKVSASDGATTADTKISLSLTRTKRIFAFADSAEDARAAKMLAGEIGTAISLAAKPYPLAPTIKATMERWYAGYHYIQPPQLQFILAFAYQGSKSAQMFYCEPPNTVLSESPIAIGKGSRAVEPWLSNVFPSTRRLNVKSALLRLAYLMYLAKRDEGSACGGNTHTIVITPAGGFTFVEEEEMNKAENLAKHLDRAFGSCLRQVTGASEEMESFSKKIAFIVGQYKQLEFPSLDFIETSKWRTKPSASQKSKPEP